MSEPKPHCARCDMPECDCCMPNWIVEGYIKHAGEKPQHPIMRSAWEHGLMIWCKAQRSESR